MEVERFDVRMFGHYFCPFFFFVDERVKDLCKATFIF